MDKRTYTIAATLVETYGADATSLVDECLMDLPLADPTEIAWWLTVQNAVSQLVRDRPAPTERVH